MAVTSLTKATTFKCRLSSIQFFSTVPPKVPQYRYQISLANLLQRCGFPPSQLHAFLARNHSLLNHSDLHDIQNSLNILLSFKIPQNSLISLLSDCPAVLDSNFLKKWQIGISKFGNLGISPLVISNVLALSRRFQIDPDGFLKSIGALKGLGFNGGVLTRVLEGFPRVIMMKENEICRKIEFFEGIGIPRYGIERIFYLFPEVLGFDIGNRLKPLLEEFVELGFSDNEARKEIVRDPRVLGMALGEMSRCLGLLRTLKCRVPVKDRILSEGEFRAGLEVKLRVDCLCKHGLIRREAFKILWKEPRLILYEIEEIEMKIDFLVNRMKYGVGCLVEVPEYLGVNFDKQIVPRYNVIEFLKSNGALGFEIGLKSLIRPSRLRFYNLYVKPYPECEKMFGRFEGDAGHQRRHPVGMWKLFKPQKYTESKEDVKNMKSFMEPLV
ncbi:transcription termination factor MTERF15, mitochondrial [Herrania umbratica]|uniref:Transcription termination factor MTERF15, mitochondrial n=1 Tax=Herrania umbratica TaxID=108875 RepID=A0A6J1AZL0_9ROSI|nr:transcription termination factor MTERF15, mitochondrial [Herrania umbratica]XP_021291828.1 transcription termination factor MTERF15, mitochondrial [Herrania umbratica]XP_021291829.1 transcription termination factor MTERF15, mitochondrial [Herrania umbratica]XP_021291830.1 transcription termination factor MTERF15, mitochondrial [Herrania umbratica]